MLQTALAWAIPDVSGKLLKRIKRENFLLREHIIEYEKKMAQQLLKQNAINKIHSLGSSIIKGMTNSSAAGNGGNENGSINIAGFSDPIEEEEDDQGVELRKRNIQSNSSNDNSNDNQITPV